MYHVEIILPKSWKKPVTYKLLEHVEVSGVCVPSGFITDGATVPRLFWCLFPPIGRYFPATTLHDYLLVKGYGWSIANKNFKQSLIDLGCRPWRVKVLMSAVTLHGWYRVLVKKDKP